MRAANYYKNGWGVEASYEMEDHYIKLAADNSENLSSKNAKTLMMLKADRGDPEALYGMFKYYYNVFNEKYFHYLKLSADRGYSLAQFELGKVYDKGFEEICPSSYGLVAQYFQKAAEQSVAEAQFLLADNSLRNLLRNND